MSEPIEIPNRALFKASEVCELAHVQPYVLRSWEAEFKDLGVAKSGSTVRVYRRADVERVLRIKHLLLVEGLTLAGVRRKLDNEAELPLEPELPLAPPPAAAADVRERIGDVKRGLRSLLDLLDTPTAGAGASAPADFAPAGSLDAEGADAKSVRSGTAGAATARSTSLRRKRSA
jgi:DNA-binding transcriptional MerR regulator